jgi:hypothetical protein
MVMLANSGLRRYLIISVARRQTEIKMYPPAPNAGILQYVGCFYRVSIFLISLNFSIFSIRMTVFLWRTRQKRGSADAAAGIVPT